MHLVFQILAMLISTFIGWYFIAWAVGYVHWAYLQTLERPDKLFAFLFVVSTFAILAGISVWQLWVWRDKLWPRLSAASAAPLPPGD